MVNINALFFVEIDLTAFKELIMLNAGEEKFTQELQVREIGFGAIVDKFQFQKIKDRKLQGIKTGVDSSHLMKKDSEFLI